MLARGAFPEARADRFQIKARSMQEPESKARGRLWLGVAVFGVLVFGIAGAVTIQLRGRALEDAGRELGILSAVLANQAERAFEAVELVQAGILERLEREGVDSPDSFRAVMSGRAVHDDLRARLQGLPQIDAVTAIDIDGNLLNFSRYWPIPRVNVADRDYFQTLRDTPGLQSFISKPVSNRGTGTATIFIARRVEAPDGAFLGLILGAMELSYFERLYETVVPGPSSAIALLRSDGTLLARFPQASGSVGTSFATATIFTELQASLSPRALVREANAIDGQDRLVAAHRLVRYPLLVTASVTHRAALAEWRRQAALLAGAALLVVAAAAAAAALLRRQLLGQRQLELAEAALELARERERSESLTRERDARFAAALANMSLGVVMYDGESRLLAANPAFAEMYELPPDLLRPGVPVEAIRRHIAAIGVADSARTLAAWEDPSAPPCEERVLPDGRIVEVSRRTVAAGGWVSTHKDVTEQRAAAARIAHMAHHDALTGLPNRVLLRERLGEALARARRGDRFAVLCLDLDRFKEVNDTLGHPVGDALLRAVTQRLLEELRETDTIARLGGDEFAIIQSAADQPTDATALSRRIVVALSTPFEIEGHQVPIGTSIGIALAPEDGEDPDTLLKAADLALYRAKEKGRGGWCFFEPQMDARMQARRALEMDLRRAIAMEEFQLYYQPVVDLGSGGVAGFEALLRWQHPQRGLVSPGDFIPLAEETGLIVPLGAWVLQRACADAVAWPAPLKVAVNLSPLQLQGAGLVRAVLAALAGSGLPPERLELEITETAMIADTEATLLILRELRDLGVSIAMDDFGTGYSSLSYLRKFPFDRVKIDRSFVQGLGNSRESVAIVQAVTSLCEALGMATTAEGVETQAQLAALSRADCAQAQGYLFSPPRPASEIARLCDELGLDAARSHAPARRAAG
jgi:diguanylate cyclase (GGDEF)-like protein